MKYSEGERSYEIRGGRAGWRLGAVWGLRAVTPIGAEGSGAVRAVGRIVAIACIDDIEG